MGTGSLRVPATRDMAGAKVFNARLSEFMPLDCGPTPPPLNPFETGLADLWGRTATPLIVPERPDTAKSSLPIFTPVVANDQFKWYYWVGPILALSFLGMMLMLVYGYYVRVLRPKWRGRVARSLLDSGF